MAHTEIRDFFLATYLLTEGYTLEEIVVAPAGARDSEQFFFGSAPGLAERVAAYQAGSARVDPKAFAQSIMALRTRIGEARSR